MAKDKQMLASSLTVIEWKGRIGDALLAFLLIFYNGHKKTT